MDEPKDQAPADPRVEAAQARLASVRQHRAFRQRDLRLGFLNDTFKRDIEKPYKQLIDLIPTWEALVPPSLQAWTRLDCLRRGTLHVVVQGSANLYELDRLLRSGLEAQIIKQQRGKNIRRLRLELGVVKQHD